MLKTIDPILGPDLLWLLAAMGHGDEIVVADRNFPSRRLARRLVELFGVDAATATAAICSVLPLDVTVQEPVLRMATDAGPEDVPEVHADVIAVVHGHLEDGQRVGTLERFAFYDHAAQAFAVVTTGERRAYGDFILRKGVL